jgi:UDP-GlcNAc3NAcA epimerase
MPEEINRVLTDHSATLLFVTEPPAWSISIAKGVASREKPFVGDTMADTMLKASAQAGNRASATTSASRRRATRVLTLNRPSNVDDAAYWAEFSRAGDVALQMPTCSPRIRERSPAG